ncbi:MAG: UDP-N-acetylglucosamine 1-carboxyvinyltransferase [Lachnospiraceae bacterium]|nr:UDP-N-acetylglucosamine 1-carboxyvinyltransferase [Lachnospiraceae bacterium]
MKQFIINGGNPLKGDVTIGGAKNAALGIIAAATMVPEPVILYNMPDIRDVQILLDVLKDIGVKVEYQDKHAVKIDASKFKYKKVDNDELRLMRGSYYLVGAMLGRFKEASVLMPGGCNIGNRPIDLHLKGMRALGANCDIDGGSIKATARRLTGSAIYLDKVSVGATINIMLAAVLAYGTTTIENAAKEPHVVDVANFLNSCGAKIKGAGTDYIRIYGVQSLHSSTYSIIPDQIEAGTMMIAAAATKGDVTLRGIIPKHLEAIAAKLSEMGVNIETGDESVRVSSNSRPKPVHITTLPYPGFPTDMQSQICALLATSTGVGYIKETLYDRRFGYVNEFERMGASIVVDNNLAVVTGVPKLKGARVNTTDMRAGAALVIAGLMAEGTTTIDNIEFIERGYENLAGKLKALGGDISLVDIPDDDDSLEEKNII